jgi:hypothetical protein
MEQNKALVEAQIENYALHANRSSAMAKGQKQRHSKGSGDKNGNYDHIDQFRNIHSRLVVSNGLLRAFSLPKLHFSSKIFYSCRTNLIFIMMFDRGLYLFLNIANYIRILRSVIGLTS